jgi:rubrerythrin
MEPQTRLGRNRTGIQMSPLQASRMAEGARQMSPELAAERGDLEVRRDYADASEGLGSVPVPGTVTGILKSGLDLMTGKRPQVLVDKLGERLAFERSGVRLYDSLLVKCSATDPGLPPIDLAMLQGFRDQEAQHFALVVEALESLGADPTAQTPCADLAGVEGSGLIQAMNDPRTSLLQSLHVILDAELLDRSGWELLIELAQATGHHGLAERLAPAARQEGEHVRQLRALVTRLNLSDAGTEPALDLPPSPAVP